MATAADTTEISYPQASLADKLRLAASKGLIDKVNELLQSGASFEPDRDGRTALHYAALSGFTTICKILIDEGCDVDSCDSLGYTALHRAAAQGHLETIKLLADEGCSIDRQDEVHGNTALHEAAWNGFSQSIELIIKNKSNVFVTNKAGFTALHLAAQNGHNESARILLYRGCSPDMKNNYGDTPLHTAARYGHAGVTRILLSAHCAVSEQNKNGDTALHISAALKRRKIAKIFMEAGIDPSVKNKQNETAVDVARRKEHPEIIIIVNQPPRKHKHHRRHDDQTVSKVPLHGPIVSAEMSSPVKGDKERRGFFFKRKKKDKDRDKTMSPQGQGHAISPGQMPQVHGSHPHQHHMKHGGGQQLGLFSKYVKKEGVQYYRDLAGNIRQGPVGFTPSCQCMPMLQKLEQRVEADRHNFYDHVDVTQQHLEQKIDDLERQTTQQVYSIDKLTRERVDAEKHDCHDRIERRVRQERLENDRQIEVQGGEIKTELKSWMANRMREHQRQQQMEENFGTTPANLERNVFENNSFRRKKGERRKKHEKDHFAGRLFRSRSDETISHSEYSYHGKAYKSRKAAMEQLRALQLSAVKEKVYRFDRSVSLRPNPVGEITRPKVMHEEAGGSPYEAFKTISEQSVDSKSTPDMSAGNFSQRRDPIDVKLLREFEDSELEKLARPHDSEVIKKKEATPEPSVKNKSESKIPMKRYPVNASSPVSSTPYFSQNRPMLSRAQYAHQKQNTSQSPHHYQQMAVPPTNNTYSVSSLTRSPYGYQTSNVRPNIQSTADVHQSSANYAEINSRLQNYAQINRNSQNTTDQDMNVLDYVDTSRKSLPSYSNLGRVVPPYSDSSKQLQNYPATRQLHNYEDISKSSLNYSDISNRSYQNYADISSLQSSGISGPDSPLIPHCTLSGADSPGQKTESGSNPDSGYGSRIYGQRPGSGPPPLPPRPMQSPLAHEYNSSHNLSVTTNMSSSFSSPQNSPHLSGTSDTNVHQATHYHDSVSEEMEKWYQRHMRDVHVDQHRVPSDHGNYSQTPNRSNYNNFMGSDV